MLKPTHPFRLLPLSAGLVALSLAGCANYSGIQSRAELRDAPSVGLTESAKQESAPAVEAQWWRTFGDSTLNELVERALQQNPGLKQAELRVQRAVAFMDSADAAGSPQVTASAEATRLRYTKNGLVPAPLAGTIQETGTLQIGASWELDFFGKNSAALRAALGSARAAEAEREAARVLLATNVTRSYFQLLRLEDQLRVAQRTLQQREEMLSLTQDRVRAGLDSQLELRQAEGALPDVRQQVEALREQATLTRHALGALVGQPQNDPVPQAGSLDQILALPSASQIPADLLGRRADITAARWRVEAATDDVRSAKAQFYPNINLAAYVGYSSLGLDRLTQTDSQQWGVGPAIRLPLFDSGRLRANLRSRTADLDLAIESYNATLIDAIRDVSDQISSLQSLARQQSEQRLALVAAESAYRIARDRYEGGLGNYLQVLSAETAVLAQRRLGVDLSARTLDTQAALMRALGGGYQSASTHSSVGSNASRSAATHSVQ